MRRKEDGKHRDFTIIGLTGGIATGKTTVSGRIENLGIPVICADAIAREMMREDAPAYSAFVRAFGGEYLRRDGALDRKKIAIEAFSRPAFRRRLERLVHPHVRGEMRRRIAEFRRQGARIVVLDVPLLFEVRAEGMCDMTVCVTCSPQLQMKRLMQRRGMTRGEALARIHAQLPLSEKARRADYTITNNGTKAELRRRIAGFLSSLRVVGQ